MKPEVINKAGKLCVVPPHDDDLSQLTTELGQIIGIGFFLIRTNISANMIYAL